MAVPTLKVVTDWVAASTLSSGDIGSYVKSYAISRGRSSELDRYSAGIATLVLDNPNGLFSPANTSSSLSGSLVPGRTVTIQWTLSGSTLKRFTGKITRYTPEPTVSGERTAIIECSDAFEQFQRETIRLGVLTNIRSGCAINSVLNNVNFPSASRDINDGQDIYDYVFVDNTNADDALTNINQTEYGTIFIRGDGYFLFHDRYYRSKITTVSASFIETMSAISFERYVDNLKTEARVSVLPRVLKPNTIIWTLQSSITVSASNTASFFGSYIDPSTSAYTAATNVASPVISTSMLMNANASGTGVDLSTHLSASFSTFAESFKIVASNAGSATGYITKSRVSGCPIVSYERMARVAVSKSACALYGLRTLTYDAELISDPDKGQGFATFLVGRYSDPVNIDKVSMVVINGTEALWQQIITRELNDRISVTSSAIGINGQEYFIGALNESWDVGGIHRVTWQLEKFGQSDGFFLIDFDIVNGTKGLGY